MAVTDATLVQQALQGDEKAFGELYDRYARMVRGICYKGTGNLSEAQDLAQDVFLRAYGKLDKLINAERFGPWLVSIARNVCREYRRGCARDRHLLMGLEPPEVLDEKDQDPEGRLEVLKVAMSHLTEREQMALSVYYLQGQDVKKAMAVLNMSRSGLFRLLASGREKLERFLRRRE